MAEKYNGQYSAILTQQAWSIQGLLYGEKQNFSYRTNVGNTEETAHSLRDTQPHNINDVPIL